jgi:predicted DNA-binding protein
VPPHVPRPELPTEATKTTISYRHKLDNKKKLTWLAERLRRPVGELLDEALEARFPEWRAQAAARSDVDPFTR